MRLVIVTLKIKLTLMKTKGFGIGIIFLVLMVCTTCTKEEALLTPEVESASLKSTKKSKDKIPICHYSADEDKWILLNVSVNALPAHEAHGDVILIDSDGDGFYPDNECDYLPSGDCDDNDAVVYPGAEEISGDNKDNDCDGQIDENDYLHGEMVYIDGFWIDRYEASLEGWIPGQDPGEFPATSIPGVFPQVNITQVQAKAACENAGKRLCTDEEWLRACRGPDGLTYPYGDTEVPDLCNWGQPDANGFLMVTGESSYCLTAEGVNDMVGNVNEWTAYASGTVRGGDYLEVGYNGPGCLNNITAFNVYFSHERIGFRCCSDDEPSVISRPMSTTE